MAAPADRQELRAWYERRLRPRLVRAVRSGQIRPVAAARLHRELAELIGLRRGRPE